MRRIVILGASGSGKTTLARDLARRFDLKHIELDALHWEPNWTPADPQILRNRVIDAVENHSWVVDGNYLTLRPCIWPHADTFIWLDYSLTVVFARVLFRTFRRSLRHEELWSGNRENLWMQFFTADSILLWVISTWRLRRREALQGMREQNRLGKRVLRFRTPRETQQWIDKLIKLSESE